MKLVRMLAFLTGLTLLAVVPLAGCKQKKEKAIDIKAPGVDIEVERSKDHGSVDVGVKPKE